MAPRKRDCSKIIGLLVIALLQMVLLLRRSDTLKEVDVLSEGMKSMDVGEAWHIANSTAKPPKPTTGVLIVAYFRSGSSFFGELFNHNPNVAYIFEPLWEFAHREAAGKALSFLDGSTVKLNYTVRDQRRDIIVDGLAGLLGCKPDRVPLSVLMHPLYLNSARMRKMRDYVYCNDKKDRPSRKCIPVFNEICRKASVRVIKSIRVDMEVAEKLLEKDSGIRIIHLIRDPRASLSSALSLGLNDPLESAANTLCFSMFRDIKKRKELERKFPGRVFQTRYEDLAERPTETLKRVYRNLDMPLPLPVKKALTKLVHGRRNLDSFGTVRKDSSATAHAWVKAISKSTAAKIDDVCSALYPWAGYKKFDLLS